MVDFPGIRRLLRLELRGSADRRREVDEEIESHLSMRVDDLVARGMPPATARAEASRRFGDIEAGRAAMARTAAARDDRIGMREWLESVAFDGRYALRQMRSARGQSAIAVVTLAMAIGLTSTVFAFVNGIVLRPLALAEPERLVAVRAVDSTARVIETVSAADAADYSAAASIAGLALHLPRTVNVSAQQSRRVDGHMVSPNFFAVIQPQLLHGRGFVEGEGVHPGAPVAVVSERLWRTVLASDSTLQRPLDVNGVPYRVVGVVAGAGVYPEGTDVWLPYREPRGWWSRTNINWQVIGRLAPGATSERAGQELAAIAARIRSTEPDAIYTFGPSLMSLHRWLVGDAADYLLLMFVAVILVLLIACANLAATGLARGATRRREIAVRAALGAGRGRIVRQLLIEHLAVAAIGGGIGVAATFVATRVVRSALAGQVPRLSEVSVDPRVLAFAVGLTTVTGILAGLAPALAGSRLSLRAPMDGASRSVTRGWGRGGIGGLIVVQVAVAVVLTIGAGLLAMSFRAVLAQSLGFRPQGVITAEISVEGPRYRSDSATTTFWRGLLAAVRQSPGVTAAGAANWVPLGSGGATFLDLEGRDDGRPEAGFRAVTDAYLPALGVELLAGRTIEGRDRDGSDPVAVVNRAMAERYWPGTSPIGRRVRAKSMEAGATGEQDAPWRTIVGVVADVRHWGYEAEPAPEMYVPVWQAPRWAGWMTMLVRGPRPAAELARVVREHTNRLDPSLPVTIESLDSRLDRATSERRFTLELLASFGAIALLLAAIGVYGMLSFAVAERRRELAVRAALGATTWELLRMVVAGGMRLVVVGSIIGLAGAAVFAQVMRSMLFGVGPLNVGVFAVATLTICATGAAAAWIPATRAARANPVEALAAE